MVASRFCGVTGYVFVSLCPWRATCRIEHLTRVASKDALKSARFFRVGDAGDDRRPHGLPARL